MESGELPSLSRLVKNLHCNQIGQPQNGVEEAEAELRRVHAAFKAATATGQETQRISGKYSVPKRTIYGWRKTHKVPDLLKDNSKAVMGSTQDERCCFAYFLGARARAAKTGKVTELGRVPANETARKRLQERIEEMMGEQYRFTQKFITRNASLLNCLNYAFSLDTYPVSLSNEGEQVAFLQGFSDVSPVLLHQNHQGLTFRWFPRNPVTNHMLLSALFGIDIYPQLRNGANYALTIRDSANLLELVEREVLIDPDMKQRIEAVRQQRVEGNTTPEMYYGVRRALQQNALDIDQAAKDFGVYPKTIQLWIGDHLDSKHQIPDSVKRYDAVRQMLGLPNVYSSTVPVWCNEKLFFPVGHRTYCMPADVQRAYAAMAGQDELGDEQIKMAWDQLKAPEDKRSIHFQLKGNRMMSVATLTANNFLPVMICVDGVSYTIEQQALFHYFISYGINPEPLTPNDVQYLEQELSDKLAGREHDIAFTIEGTRVTGISVKSDPIGSRKSIKEHDGILGTSHLTLFGGNIIYG
ncbi:hypothetical protein HYS47_02980 [Candidatus Woesearchaeota archaeon]|nr:hypothetical protein [Candidatus Woesearchaeota archaeon]